MRNFENNKAYLIQNCLRDSLKMPKQKNYKELLKEKVTDLKRLGVKYVELKGMDPRIAYEMSAQMCKLIATYGNYIDWFGNIQALIYNDYENRVQNNIKRFMMEEHLSEEIALKLAKQKTEKKIFKGKNYAGCVGGYKLYSKDGYEKISLIFFNMRIIGNYNKFKADLTRDVETGCSPRNTDIPKAIVTHEFAHSIYLYLDSAGLLDSYTKNVLIEAFKTRSKEISIYATKNFDEFIAEAFTESIHNSKPSKISLLVRTWIEESVQNLRKQEA